MHVRLAITLILASVLTAGARSSAMPPFFDQWKTFDKDDGLPSEKILCIYSNSDFVWAGTDKGIARFDGTQWKSFGEKDGLAQSAVMAITQDAQTGDMWFATLGGLSRYSGGRFDTFTQLNSGLPNNIVYGLAIADSKVWAATAAGTGRYNIGNSSWTLYDETNTPMHETWCYSAADCGDKVYLAVWGGGLLEYDRPRNRWKDYTDPDGEMEIDLFRNDGLVHDVVASVACDKSGIVWVGTYFGLSTYDGRKWLNFMDHDPAIGGLVSNFINFVTTQGEVGWIATDKGINATDRKDWWTYQRDNATGEGVVTWSPAAGAMESTRTDTMFAHNYVLGISFRGDEIWVATEKGVSRGRRSQRKVADASPRAGSAIGATVKLNEEQ